MVLSEAQIYQHAELIEAHFLADFMRAAPVGLATRFAISVQEDLSFTTFIVKNSAEFAFYNRVLALGVAHSVAEAALEGLVEQYRQANLGFMVQLSPFAQPVGLSQRLAALGFKPTGNSAKFYHHVTSLPEAVGPFRLEQVVAEHIGDFSRIACDGFSSTLADWLASTAGRTGWHHYLAYLEDVPVSAGALCIKGEVGHLSWAATLPAYRGQGAQTALLTHRLREAARLGCRLVIVDTGEDTPAKPNPSYRNILRVGFKLAYLRPKYVFTPEAKDNLV